MVDLLSLTVTVALVALAVLGARLWWRARSTSTMWLFWMFGVLGAGRLVSALLPEERAGISVVMGVAASALIVTFPYLLFRFADSFEPVRRHWRVAVGAVAAATVLAAIGVNTAAAVDGARPDWYPLYLVGVVGVWTGLTAWVVWRLWWSGRAQATLTRRRMATMAAATGLLNVALWIAAYSWTEAVAVAAQAVAFASAAAFGLTFWPPWFIRQMWRRRDEQELWRTESSLIAADSRDAVVTAVLPHVANLLGGAGAVFIDRGGTETAVGFGAQTPERDHVRQRLHDAPDGQVGATVGAGVATMVLKHGRLGVATSAYTPLFGSDELELFARLGSLLDLALSRVDATEWTAAFKAFEHGLVPRPDPPAGLHVEFRYLTGVRRLRLGGDFMDVIALAEDAAAFVVGDVSGHGPEEAAFAVGIHAAWHAMANASPQSPSTWLAMLDESSFKREDERLATALTGRVDIAQRSFTLSSAGHCHPILVGADTRILDIDTDPLLGIGSAAQRKETTVALDNGQGLLLYTDGLIEQRKPHRSEERWREEDLVAWLTERDCGADIDLDALLWDFGRNHFADDVAVMLLRFSKTTSDERPGVGYRHRPGG